MSGDLPPLSIASFPRAWTNPGARLRLSACEHPLELLEACLPELIASGARVQQPPRVEPFGAEAWLEDPEQNPLLVVAPSI